MGKMPVLLELLVGGLQIYPRKRGKEIRVVPFGKVVNNYCTDYLLATIEMSADHKVVHIV